MPYVYLIRHGQAGSRDDYDVLSELGRAQSAIVGRHLAETGVELDAVYAGAMRRQQETAELAVAEYSSITKKSLPMITDERWNEFSLADLYKALSRRIAADEPDFARDFELMREELKRDPHNIRGATGRCDVAVIRAWVEQRYKDYEGESWLDFRARVLESLGHLGSNNHHRAVAVFTSATPIVIAAGAALKMSDPSTLMMLGVMYNANISLVRARESDLRLFTLNSSTHLHESQRTFR